MCWNAEVSLQSFLIGAVAIAIGYSKGLSLPSTLFATTITSMQLVEYFVWTYYGNPTVNFVASLAAAFLLWLQPIASMLTIPKEKVVFPIAIYTLLTVAFLLFETKPLKEKYKMVRGENGHLTWGFINKNRETYIHLIVYFLFLLVPLVINKQFLLLSVVGLTLGISLYSFHKSNTWGSMWCWLVNYIVVGLCIRQVLITSSF